MVRFQKRALVLLCQYLFSQKHQNPTEPEIYKLARQKGMLTMKEDAILKSAQGVIPLQEVYNFE
jgi:type II secretory ATPase GspE/PulE/Tfp pilus assembly ATPase PilB-like protein